MADIHSMTAFARTEKNFAWGTLAWEIRSINHRYLEMSFRLPETFRQFEPEFREQLRKAFKRGKIECSLQFQAATGSDETLVINEAVARQYVQAAQLVASMMENPLPLGPADILFRPGVLQERKLDNVELGAAAGTLFTEAIELLSQARGREGQALAGLIRQRLDAMGTEIETVRTVVPQILQAQRTKLLERLDALQGQFDPQRLEQELVLLAQKTDVTEEIDRLGTHIAEVGRLLTGQAAVGRKLDFLMQELNREANTLGSKSINVDTTRASIELKVLIEQMREQVQNIE